MKHFSIPCQALGYLRFRLFPTACFVANLFFQNLLATKRWDYEAFSNPLSSAWLFAFPLISFALSAADPFV
jgi:hypothetical protein